MSAEHTLRNKLTILVAAAEIQQEPWCLFSPCAVEPTAHAFLIASLRRVVMASITLSDLSQFIDELKYGRRYVEMSLVRLAEIENEGFWCSNIHLKHVIVTARVGQDIVRLDLFYGPPSGHEEHDREVVQAMARDLAQLREACQECGLKIRHGVLEEAMVLQ